MGLITRLVQKIQALTQSPRAAPLAPLPEDPYMVYLREQQARIEKDDQGIEVQAQAYLKEIKRLSHLADLACSQGNYERGRALNDKAEALSDEYERWHSRVSRDQHIRRITLYRDQMLH